MEKRKSKLTAKDREAIKNAPFLESTLVEATLVEAVTVEAVTVEATLVEVFWVTPNYDVPVYIIPPWEEEEYKKPIKVKTVKSTEMKIKSILNNKSKTK